MCFLIFKYNLIHFWETIFLWKHCIIQLQWVCYIFGWQKRWESQIVLKMSRMYFGWTKIENFKFEKKNLKNNVCLNGNIQLLLKFKCNVWVTHSKKIWMET